MQHFGSQVIPYLICFCCLNFLYFQLKKTWVFDIDHRWIPRIINVYLQIPQWREAPHWEEGRWSYSDDLSFKWSTEAVKKHIWMNYGMLRTWLNWNKLSSNFKWIIFKLLHVKSQITFSDWHFHQKLGGKEIEIILQRVPGVNSRRQLKHRGSQTSVRF